MKTKFLFSAALLLCSCSIIRVTPPPRIPFDQPSATEKTSTVAFHTSVAQSDVVNAFRKEITNPIITDETVSVVAEIKAIETITEDKLVKNIISPYTPGHWIDVSTRTFQTVKEAFSCWLQPWKWGTCWRDVIKEVWVTTKVWVEPQLEVFEWVAVKVVSQLDRLYKHDVKIHYPTDATDFDISFSGNSFEATADFTTYLALDYDQQLIPLGPTLTLKSILKTDVDSHVRVRGTINIVAPGKIQVILDQNATTFSFDPFDPGLPILDRNIKLADLLTPLIGTVARSLTERFAESSINKAIQKAIDHNEDNLDFRAQLNDFAVSLADPKQLADNVWLNVTPSRILSGQLTGVGKRIFYSAALEFKPFVEFSPVLPTVQPNDVPFVTNVPFDELSSIDLRLQVKLAAIGQVLKDSLNAHIGKQTTIKKFIRVSDIELFKTNDDRLAIRIEIQRKRLFGNWTFFANAYITNHVAYKPSGHFSLEDIEFTLETKNAIAGSIINALIDKPVETLLKDNSTYSISDQMRIANSAIQDTTISLPYGTIQLQFAPIGIPQNPYVTDKNLEVTAHLEGKITFYYIPKDQQPLYSPTYNGEQLIAMNTTTSAPALKRAGNIITDDALQPRAMYSRTPFVDFERIDFMDPTATKTTLPSMPKPGEIIFTEVNGGFAQHVVGFEDVPPTDEFLVSVIPGKIERVRVNSLELRDRAKSDVGQQSKTTVRASEQRTDPPVIAVNEAINHLDKLVTIRGTLACISSATAPSGEIILTLRIDNCTYKDVAVLVYHGSVTDHIPDDSYLNKQIDIDAIVGFENGKPTIKIKENGKIKLAR